MPTVLGGRVRVVASTVALLAIGGVAPGDEPLEAAGPRVFAVLIDAPLPTSSGLTQTLPDGPVTFLADLPADAVEIAAVGDVNLGERVGAAIGAHGADHPWRNVTHVLAQADVAVANLEGTLSRRGTPEPKEFTFRGDPSSAAGMARAGMDVVSVANNHAMDFGRDAFADTLEAVRAHGIEPVGGGANADEACGRSSSSAAAAASRSWPRRGSFRPVGRHARHRRAWRPRTRSERCSTPCAKRARLRTSWW
jgi:hypothetical protein